MANQDQNQNNKDKNKDNKDSTAPDLSSPNDPKYFEDINREGGINPANNVPSKGGRYGNASVEDGGSTEGSSAGSH